MLGGCCMIGRAMRDEPRAGPATFKTPNPIIIRPCRPLPGLDSKTAVEASKGAREHQRHRQTSHSSDQNMTPTTELEVPYSPQEQVREDEVGRAPQDVDQR